MRLVLQSQLMTTFYAALVVAGMSSCAKLQGSSSNSSQPVIPLTQTDFEDGTLGSFSVDGGGSSCANDSADPAFSGTHSVKCTTSLGGTARLTYTPPGMPEINGSDGLWIDFEIKTDAATVAAVNLDTHYGQMKTFLYRENGTQDSTHKAWIMSGLGPAFGSSPQGEFTNWIDWGIQSFPGGLSHSHIDFGDAKWHRVRQHYKRNPGMGHVQIWIDDMSNVAIDQQSADLGTDATDLAYSILLGIVFSDNRAANAGTLTIWLDDVFVGLTPPAQ